MAQLTIDEKAPNLARLLHHLDDGVLLRQLEEHVTNLPRIAQERGGKPTVTLAVEFGKFDSQKVYSKGKLTVKEPEPARTEAIFYVTETGLSRENPLQRRLAMSEEEEIRTR